MNEPKVTWNRKDEIRPVNMRQVYDEKVKIKRKPEKARMSPLNQSLNKITWKNEENLVTIKIKIFWENITKNIIVYNATYEIWIGRKEGKDPIAKLSYSGSPTQDRSFHWSCMQYALQVYQRKT